MALYSEKVMDHFRNPRNVGVIEDANGIGEVGNAKCGDIMKMYLKIEDDIVKDVKFETFPYITVYFFPVFPDILQHCAKVFKIIKRSQKHVGYALY